MEHDHLAPMADMPGRWILFAILFALFFIAEDYNLFYSVNAVIDERAAVTSIAEAGAGSRLRPIAFAALALIGAICWMMRPAGRAQAPYGWFAFLISAFVAYAMLSVTWAWEFDLVLRRVIIFALICVAVFGVAHRLSNRDLVMFGFAVGGFAAVLGLAGELASGTFMPWIPEYRFYGIMHANTLGGTLAIFILAALTLARTTPGRRGLFIIAAALGVGLLILTKSRGAAIAAIVAIWTMYLLGAQDRRRLLWLSILALGLIVPVLGFVLGETFDDMLRGAILLGREGQSPETLTGRVPLWAHLISNYVAERPFFGFGFNGFWTPQHVLRVSASQDWLILTAHSGYLSLLLELGALGLGLVTIVVIIALRRSYRNFRTSGDRTWLFMNAVLVWAIVNSLFDVVLLEPTLRNFICLLVLAKLALVRPLPARAAAPALA